MRDTQDDGVIKEPITPPLLMTPQQAVEMYNSAIYSGGVLYCRCVVLPKLQELQEQCRKISGMNKSEYVAIRQEYAKLQDSIDALAKTVLAHIHSEGEIKDEIEK